MRRGFFLRGPQQDPDNKKAVYIPEQVETHAIYAAEDAEKIEEVKKILREDAPPPLNCVRRGSNVVQLRR